MALRRRRHLLYHIFVYGIKAQTTFVVSHLCLWQLCPHSSVLSLSASHPIFSPCMTSPSHPQHPSLSYSLIPLSCLPHIIPPSLTHTHARAHTHTHTMRTVWLTSGAWTSAQKGSCLRDELALVACHHCGYFLLSALAQWGLSDYLHKCRQDRWCHYD